MSEGNKTEEPPAVVVVPLTPPSSPLRPLPRPGEESEGIATQLLGSLKGGKTSAGDAAILLKILDDIDENKWRREQRDKEEKEEREERRSRSQANNDGSKKREEDPKIVKLEADMKIILEHMQGADRDKHDIDLIEKTTEKVTKAQLERIKTLEDKIASIPSATIASDGQKPRSELQILKESAQNVKETAALMGMKDASSIQPASASITSSGTVFEGIPVSGSIPAYLAAIPIVLEKVIEQIDKLATKYLGPLQKEEEEPMITLPPKPELEPEEPEPQPEPPHTTVQQKPEEEILEMPLKPEPEPEPEPPHIVTIKKIEVQQKIPEEQILKMPQKPEEKTEREALALPEASNKASTQATEVSGSTQASEVSRTFSLAVGPPKMSEKEYTCKYCGQGGFKKPLALASHSKKCPAHPRNQPKKEIPKDATLSKAEEEDVAASLKEIEDGKSKSFKTADEVVADLKKPSETT